MLREIHADVAIIGAGTAGLSAFRAARAFTQELVLIESGLHGTTCARSGCIPSKLLIAAADAAHHMNSASIFGIEPGAFRVDGKAVMERVRRERDRLVSFVVDSVNKIEPGMRLQGKASFITDKLIQVGETRIHARATVIATGARPIIPQFLKDLGPRLLTYEDLFEMVELPESLAVFGTGLIGLEIGQALHRLGVRVAIFGRGGSVGPLTDPHLREASRTILGAELRLFPRARVSAVTRVEEGVRIEYGGEVAATSETFQYLLCAVGREPNLRGLGLERTGLELDRSGIPYRDPHTLRIGKSSLFIAGDANQDRPLLHEAVDEGQIAGANAARYPDLRAGLRRTPLSIVFTDPQMAMVGSKYRELREGQFAVGQAHFEDQGRSRIMGVNRGTLRLYAESGTGRFLGAEMMGPAAEHLAHLLAWSHQLNLKVQQMLEMPFYHPVIEEAVRTALRDVLEKLKMGPVPVPRCLDCGPGA